MFQQCHTMYVGTPIEQVQADHAQYQNYNKSELLKIQDICFKLGQANNAPHREILPHARPANAKSL